MLVCSWCYLFGMSDKSIITSWPTSSSFCFCGLGNINSDVGEVTDNKNSFLQWFNSIELILTHKQARSTDTKIKLTLIRLFSESRKTCIQAWKIQQRCVTIPYMCEYNSASESSIPGFLWLTCGSRKTLNLIKPMVFSFCSITKVSLLQLVDNKELQSRSQETAHRCQ